MKLNTVLKVLIIFLLFVCNASISKAQLAVNSAVSVTDLITAISGQGVIITNATLNCPNGAYATFTGGAGSLGLASGILLTTGDATNKDNAQNLSSLGGKILRINTDGSFPSDNPFPNSTVWSFGHRNPQGLDWHPKSKLLYSTEHGPSGFDGPGRTP